MKTTHSGSLLPQHSVCCSKTCSFSVRGHSHLLTKQLHPPRRARPALVLFSFKTWMCKRSPESHVSMATYHRRMSSTTFMLDLDHGDSITFNLPPSSISIGEAWCEALERCLAHPSISHGGIDETFIQVFSTSFFLLTLQPPFNIHQIANGTDILRLSFAMLEPSSYPIIRVLMVKLYIF